MHASLVEVKKQIFLTISDVKRKVICRECYNVNLICMLINPISMERAGVRNSDDDANSCYTLACRFVTGTRCRAMRYLTFTNVEDVCHVTSWADRQAMWCHVAQEHACKFESELHIEIKQRINIILVTEMLFLET
jgi:hypothetical protein